MFATAHGARDCRGKALRAYMATWVRSVSVHRRGEGAQDAVSPPSATVVNAHAGAALASSPKVVNRALNFAAAAPSSIHGSGVRNTPQGTLTPPRQRSTSPSPVPARVCEGR